MRICVTVGKLVMVGQFEVLDVVWNENLGGDHMDWILVEYFTKRFHEKFGQDLTTSNRSIMKLKKAVGKTKHILSANTEAHIYVEELFDGNDFNDKITRSGSISLLPSDINAHLLHTGQSSMN